jgi:hypothetical protein
MTNYFLAGAAGVAGVSAGASAAGAGAIVESGAGAVMVLSTGVSVVAAFLPQPVIMIVNITAITNKAISVIFLNIDSSIFLHHIFLVMHCIAFVIDSLLKTGYFVQVFFYTLYDLNVICY